MKLIDQFLAAKRCESPWRSLAHPALARITIGETDADLSATAPRVARPVLPLRRQGMTEAGAPSPWPTQIRDPHLQPSYCAATAYRLFDTAQKTALCQSQAKLPDPHALRCPEENHGSPCSPTAHLRHLWASEISTIHCPPSGLQNRPEEWLSGPEP